MNFYKTILKWKDNNSNEETKNGNQLICHVHENVQNDYLHVLFYSLDRKAKKELEKYLCDGDKRAIKQYVEFLSEHNGAVLYSGAIVFFGWTNYRGINTFVEPAPLAVQDEKDKISKTNSDLIFIGNIMHRDYDNINMYLNISNGKIIWYHKNEIIKAFNALDESLEHIISFYNDCYKINGEHRFYNDRSKNVYENIQLY